MNKSYSDMRVVIPGGAGLVGQNLVVKLKELGFKRISVLDKHEQNLNVLSELHPNVSVDCVDLSKPGTWLEHITNCDVVIMLQAQIGGLDKDTFYRNNVDSTKLILNEIRRSEKPAKLIHVSSSVVNSVAEDWYTETKTIQEQLVKNSGIAATILRPTLMFGWFDRKHMGWLASFMKKLPIFPIPGHGRYLRQPLYVGDFCDIIISIMRNSGPVGCFDITGQQSINYIDLIKLLKKSTNSSTIILRIPFRLFSFLLKLWGIFDKNPPFTASQLEALVAGDIFQSSDWEDVFGVQSTDLQQAFSETYTHPRYSKIKMEF